MRREAKHDEGCEYTDPYLYSIFAQQREAERAGGSRAGRENGPGAVRREQGRRRRAQSRLLFLLGLLPPLT
jgi:hypothetical protein